METFEIPMRTRRAIDPYAFNDALISLLREEDGRLACKEATQARRAGMTRQAMHHIHTDLKVMTIPALTKWANGRRLNPLFVAALALARLFHKNT
ncbi:MAG: hypothetical protein HS117_00925 [Verrucomicrobiaceae bacterium]|jgi:DNA-binding XRE family transcriptional regulator|nr:hypothetical protein [Verrucomicrobiaceae bacterium]